MKKLFTLFLIVFLSGSFCRAANYYNFSHTTSNYTELVNPTIITTDFSQEGYPLNLGTNFKMFGVDFSASNGNLEVEAFGTIIGMNTSMNRMFAVEGFAVKKFLSKDTTSSISYTLDGTAGSQILKVQYKNVTPKDGDATKDFVNFQIWLYEDGSKIEVHIGQSHIESSSISKIFTFDMQTGPTVGIFLSNMDFSTKYEVTFLSGNPANPGVSASVTAALNAIPADGDMYAFEHKDIVVPAKLELVSPVAMEVWKVGEKQEIKWKSNLVKTIKIEYSTHGFGDYVLIADNVDATTQEYLWTVPNTPSQECVVKLTDNDDPTRFSESAMLFTIVKAASVNEKMSVQNIFNVYPNPAKDIFNISLLESNSKILQLKVYTTSGKVLVQNTLPEATTTSIDLGAQPAGVYILNVVTEKGAYTSLLQKQ